MEDLKKQLEELQEKLSASLDAKTKKEVEAQIASLKSAIEKSAKESLEEVKAELKVVKDEADKMKGEFNDYKAEIGRKVFNGKEKAIQLSEEIKENKEKLKLVAKRATTEEIEIKANTLRSSIATNEHLLTLDGVGQLARKRISLYEFFPKLQVGRGNHNGTVTYLDWDEATVVKASAMVAEGAAFPESTAAFKMYTLPLRKVGDTLPVSEEFFEDEQLAAAELSLFLNANVMSKIGDEIITGDGTGQRLTGLVSSVPAYTPVASGIADANIYDLIIKVMESITSTGGAKYQPDFVAMNIADINKLRLKKDANNNYVFERQDERINSLNIIEDNNLTANTLVLGDSRFARIYEMGGVVLSQGEINAQFTSDMMTIKARKRLAFLIREADKTGFKKVTSISAALTTLAT